MIDIGANLAHDSFDDDLDTVLQEAREAGVERIILTGSSDQSNLETFVLAQKFPGFLHSTAGVHPHHAADYTDASETLIRDLLKNKEVIAVGECGLDYFRDIAPRDVQMRTFERQLNIARDSQKPVFLHQRDAHDDYLKILDPVLSDIGPAVTHCFTGNKAELADYIERDLYVGITGWLCDERRGKELQEIVADIPDDRLMVETDAPYLLPRTLSPRPKSRRNEPKYLPEVLRVLAKCRAQSLEHVAAITTENAKRFFGI